MLETEFNTFRGLKPVKIFISGPPASGKTYYAEQLAHYYNIPRVHVGQLVEKVFEMVRIPEEEADAENVLQTNCRTKIEEIKAAMTEKIEEERANQEPPEGEEWPEIEIKEEDVRVPDDLLQEILKIKLGENDCRNRGYILDSYPRTFKGAQYSFLTKPPPKLNADGEPEEEEEDPGDDEEAEPNWEKMIKNDAIFPGSIIVLEGTD